MFFSTQPVQSEENFIFESQINYEEREFWKSLHYIYHVSCIPWRAIKKKILSLIHL